MSLMDNHHKNILLTYIYKKKKQLKPSQDNHSIKSRCFNFFNFIIVYLLLPSITMKNEYIGGKILLNQNIRMT